MAWEVLRSDKARGGRTASHGSFVYFPGSNTKSAQKGQVISRLELCEDVVEEMKWAAGDKVLVMVDREAKLIGLKRDKQGQFTINFSSYARKNPGGKPTGKFRIGMHKKITEALRDMWGVSIHDPSITIGIEHIIEGHMVIFSRKGNQ
jgi:bifunctional DNA-binding transcriptional regulator/antitoxin component of YhaV-PrlF toxin-antitoxin module